MRRFTWVVALVMVCLSLAVAGCGKKDAGSVVKELDGVMSKLQSYHGKGQMTLRTGQDPQEYDVEVSFQAPSFYRISLTNAKKDITQIVLRNDDGVFVLTPHLNKSFRFQSDWPENQGQVYLYQSLVQSILMDNERHFTSDEKAYVFDVVANYQNGSLARQKVWLDKRNYAPQHVEVSDANSNVMVIVKFDQFEFGTKFEKDQFDMQRNMTGWNLKTLPTMTQGDSKAAKKSGATDSKAGAGATGGNEGAGAQGTTQETGGKGTAAGQGAGADAKGGATGTSKDNTAGAAAGESKGTSVSGNGEGAKTSSAGGDKGAASNGGQAEATGAKKDTSKQQSFGIIEPRYMPSGVKKQDVTELKLGEEQAVMLRYSGKYNYTLVESRPQVQTVSILPGDILDLGFTLGVVTGDAKKTLTWTYDGIEFRLSTGDLPETEMIKVAQAVQGEMGK
ncbi:outer membrane lipoprotein-sorting protein [Paenibacillus ehimensis]|uniref:Outer membrane lipoprotein carrier protein LolA n=1 Tax=Paenibacillus ehimensis TaxID=79264 RepID=A0ABT8VH29_9BACL|nr:outer membrane lipoprotein-sorting protein [Paenibacillus ehimensis]MDO3680282.1 outer membrane lipoprotein carrier protein LolA [Paenibacillus ehimensis]